MSIEQIRDARPVPNSIHNLIQTMSVKLDSAARYGLYEADAREEGFDDCAELFARLGEQDHAGIEELLRCLGNHLPAAASQ
jgi:hypothetical protein